MISTLVVPIVAALALAAAMSSGARADPPRRIVSFDRCGDQLVLALADRDQIAGVSIGARDPRGSFMADPAREVPMLLARADVALKAGADLVLVPMSDRSRLRRLVEAFRIRVVEIEPPEDLRHATDQVREIADLVGRPERGAALVRAIGAAQARLAALRPNPAPSALALERRAPAWGSRKLLVAYLGEAGFRPPPEIPGGFGGTVTAERLLASGPDLLVIADTPSPEEPGPSPLPPPVERRWPAERRLEFPERFWMCGGPAIPAALDRLADELQRIRR